MACCVILIITYNECALAECVHAEIDQYYECFMSCIKSACLTCLPARQLHPVWDYVVTVME